MEVEQRKHLKRIETEILPLKKYFLAEEYHQNYLEKNWLDELTKKYPIVINDSVLYNLGN